MKTKAPVTKIVDTLDEMAEEGAVDAGHLLDAFGKSAVAPALLVPSLLVVSPLSGIPLFSSICGFVIVVIALQGALGRRRLWLPDMIKRRSLPARKTHDATALMRKIAGILDWMTRRRLVMLVRPPMVQLLYLACAVMAACIPLLEFVPLSSSVIGAGVALTAVAILAKDGLVALAGLAFLCAAAAIPWFVVSAAAKVVG